VHDPEGPDADHCGPANVTDPGGPQPRSGVTAGVVTPVSELGAEDEVAKAEARAKAARARVSKLRMAAETGDADDDAASRDVAQRRAKSSRVRLRLPRRPGRLRRPGWLRLPGGKTIAAGVGIVLTAASLGASGYMIWQHHTVTHNRQLADEFAKAAQKDVTMLMSLDAQHAREDIQRVIDACTGDLKKQLEATSSLMVEKAQESKASSKASVEAVAVESFSENSAVVLVAAKTDVTNADNTNRPPVVWRISVGITRDGGQLKMSKVDFLQ